ncbi:NapC/NirT cytochrome c domain protein [Desulfovibrio sp. X2]|uniref:cytochrome c3 family protein n=1 Tax=Desulfovibrio sp. X2 TaxID=941449 RepID=UPI0003589626|nr:NapC/NirT family cytochrome c [Desulfovibrio sp. X2]EPR37483.1 NapC/NirT cytochrome c domain protein [Desulfovibrio sp. X2]
MAPRAWLKPLVLVLVGVVVAFPLFIGTMRAMAVTSTPEFCGSCHEISPAVSQWRTSPHAANSRGLQARCMDCHLPRPEDTASFFIMKTYHGLKDVTAHVLHGADAYDAQEARENVWRTMDNENCLKCHKDILYIPTSRGAMLAHRSVLYPRPGEKERRCTDCHYRLVHEERAAYANGRDRLPYQARGLRSAAVLSVQ